MIAASHLTRQFGTRVVVDDVSLTVGRGELVALLGPNGAGKTTTMRMLAGLIRPTRGAAAIDGVELTERNGSRLRRRIGFLTEAPGLWDRLAVRENLEIYARLYDVARPSAAVDAQRGTLEGHEAESRACASACARSRYRAARRADRRTRSGDREARARSARRATRCRLRAPRLDAQPRRSG